ncbi:MAG: outer membrane protein assembly factor BamD [Acidobacteria bacterium]|nr:outer membrane protein assembly factor BamD [Acidobacteriota bacterium]
MTRRISPALALLLLGLATPAAAQNREHQQMAAELRLLQEQTQQLAITLAALNQALAESVKTLNTTLNARLEEVSGAMRKSFADQKLLTDNMANDVSKIRERGDDTNVRIAALREELEALRVTVQALQQTALAPPPVPVDPTAPLDPNAPAPVPAPVAPPPALPSTAGLSPTRLYETAQADYFAGQWSSAISGFEAFLRAFPRSEQGDDAQLYIGETYFAQNQWAEATAAYNQVIQSYAGTNSVPVAYYKRGLAQERLGQIDAARASWEAAAKNFPDSDAGRLARQTLDRLNRAQPTPPR